MLANIDWLFLRKSLIIFIFSLVLVLVFVFSGQYYESIMEQTFQQSRSSLSSAHSRYNQLVQDLDLLQQFTEKYEEYKSTGVLGGERRLSWIETLEIVNEDMMLPRLAYNLEPQQHYDMPKFQVDASVSVFSTPMGITMDLLHEGDLLLLIQKIGENISSLYTVEQCQIKKIGGGKIPLNTQKANFNSECLLRWITVNVRES